MQQADSKGTPRMRKVAALVLITIFLTATPALAGSKVLVRYFHGNVRCSTCLMFEDWSKAAFDAFPKEQAAGRLEWQLINFDLPENKHYIKDYALADKALVLVREEDGKQVRWKNVEEFWDFGDNQKKEFVLFVQGLIADFLTNNSTGEDHD